MIRVAGAREVHMRISSPPTIGPCRYGIDTPTREELIASHNSVDQIRDFVGADSLGYLSLPGLYESVEGQPGRERDRGGRPGGKGFCDACFSGNYPIVPSRPGACASSASSTAADSGRAAPRIGRIVLPGYHRRGTIVARAASFASLPRTCRAASRARPAPSAAPIVAERSGLSFRPGRVQ